jgi:hypothetical protein
VSKLLTAIAASFVFEANITIVFQAFLGLSFGSSGINLHRDWLVLFATEDFLGLIVPLGMSLSGEGI